MTSLEQQQQLACEYVQTIEKNQQLIGRTQALEQQSDSLTKQLRNEEARRITLSKALESERLVISEEFSKVIDEEREKNRQAKEECERQLAEAQARTVEIDHQLCEGRCTIIHTSGGECTLTSLRAQ